MRDYWKADFFRVLTARVVWVTLAISLVFHLLVTLALDGAGTDSLIGGLQLTGLVSTLSLGLGLLSAIYSQDVKAGAMRVAIGRGLSRNRIVLLKFVESLGFSLVFSALLTAWYLLLAGLFAPQAGSDLARAAVATGIDNFLAIILFTAIAVIWLLGSQQAVGAVVLFVLSASGLVDQLLSLVLSQPAVIHLTQTNLTPYLPSWLSRELAQWLATGQATAGSPLAQLAVLIAYLLVCLLLSCLLFNRKELEF